MRLRANNDLLPSPALCHINLLPLNFGTRFLSGLWITMKPFYLPTLKNSKSCEQKKT
jgi:hypothetical protein